MIKGRLDRGLESLEEYFAITTTTTRMGQVEQEEEMLVKYVNKKNLKRRT